MPSTTAQVTPQVSKYVTDKPIWQIKVCNKKRSHNVQ